jgi:protein phosphatase
MAFLAAGQTDVGLVRKENQDNFLMMPQQGVFAVADGMGGHAGGKQASTIAVEVLTQRIASEQKLERRIIDSALEEANHKILERARQDQMQGMGTTLTLAFYMEGCWQVVHIGDSRAYAITAEGAFSLTQDHSLVGELLAQGSITRDEAQNHPHRNILTRALGSEEKALPEWNQVDAGALSYLLLCTDGLYNMLSDEEIKGIALSEDQTLEEKASAMIELARHRGGFDNITAILIQQED